MGIFSSSNDVDKKGHDDSDSEEEEWSNTGVHDYVSERPYTEIKSFDHTWEIVPKIPVDVLAGDLGGCLIIRRQHANNNKEHKEYISVMPIDPLESPNPSEKRDPITYKVENTKKKVRPLAFMYYYLGEEFEKYRGLGASPVRNHRISSNIAARPDHTSVPRTVSTSCHEILNESGITSDDVNRHFVGDHINGDHDEEGDDMRLGHGEILVINSDGSLHKEPLEIMKSKSPEVKAANQCCFRNRLQLELLLLGPTMRDGNW